MTKPSPGLSCGMRDLQSSLRHVAFSCCMRTLSHSMWDLVPWPGIEPESPALGAWNLSHWTTREVPNSLIFHFHSWEFFHQVSTPLLTKSNPSDFRDHWIHALKIETQAPEIPNKSYFHLWRSFWWAWQATRVNESLQASHSSHLRWFPSHWSTHHWGLWT